MQVEMILETVKKTGGKLAVINGVLKAKNLTESTRQLVKSHRIEIIQLLIKLYTEQSLKPCPLCSGIEFVHGGRGGYFCINCQPEHEGVSVLAGGKRFKADLKGDNSERHTPIVENRTDDRISRGDISPSFKISHKWISQHKIELLGAGWTPPELYRRNKSRGIAWMKVWSRPDLTVAVGKSGEIVFCFKNTAGKSVQQTAFPRGHMRKRAYVKSVALA